jgi:hypothetical protein
LAARAILVQTERDSKRLLTKNQSVILKNTRGACAKVTLPGITLMEIHHATKEID